MKHKNTAATAISCTVILGSKEYAGIVAWDSMRLGQFITKNAALAVVPAELQADAFASANQQLASYVNANCESVLKVGKRKQAIVGSAVNDTVSINYNLGLCQDIAKVGKLIDSKVADHNTASADLIAMRDAQILKLTQAAEAELVEAAGRREAAAIASKADDKAKAKKAA